jgi:o-succinylbenzoate---CoA ligase
MMRSWHLIPTAHHGQNIWPFIFPGVSGAVRWLHELGITRGTRVGLGGINSPQTVALLQALPLVGATTILFNQRLTTAELTQQVARAAVDRCISELTHPLHEGSISIPEYFTDSSLPKVSPLTDVDPAFILFTSGTSGTAKAARLSWRAIRHAAQAAQQVLQLSPHTPWLACLPLDHIGGASMVFRAGFSGNPLRLCDKFTANEIAPLIEEQQVYGMSVVPTMLQRLITARDHRSWPQSLKIILTGGGPLSAQLINTCSACGLPPSQTYGLTEAASQVTTLLPHEAMQHPGSAGRALPGTEIVIRDGHIAIRGPTLFDGYEENGILSTPHQQQDYFFTGDLGSLDEHGYLTVHSRRTDLIISGGENVYPAEIEQVLTTYPHISEAAVFALPDPQWGHSVNAALVVSSPIKVAELQAWMKSKLAAFKLPKQYFFVEALPKTSLGKIQRDMLVQRFSA